MTKKFISMIHKCERCGRFTGIPICECRIIQTRRDMAAKEHLSLALSLNEQEQFDRAMAVAEVAYAGE